MSRECVVSRIPSGDAVAGRGVIGWCLRLACGVLLAGLCMGPGCQNPLDLCVDQSPIDPSLEDRVEAASAALIASDGHDYGPITDLLEEHYGDEATTTWICSAFTDAPHCLRITAVNIQADHLDPQWQQHFCELEKLAWESFSDDGTAEGQFQDCMAGLPFLAY